MKVTTIGMDLAKNVIQVHGVDAHGKTALKKPLKRGQMAPFFGKSFSTFWTAVPSRAAVPRNRSRCSASLAAMTSRKNWFNR